MAPGRFVARYGSDFALRILAFLRLVAWRPAGRRPTRCGIGIPMMKTRHMPTRLATAFVGGLVMTSAHAQHKTPGFNQKIPGKIMTPDKVEIRLGTLHFVAQSTSYVSWVPLCGFLVNGSPIRAVKCDSVCW
jgi:hypothetical protein